MICLGYIKYYVARFVARFGKRQSKRFKKLEEARKWLADSIYIDEHSNISIPREMTVDAFYEFWFDTKRKMLKPNTADLYESQYKNAIKPVIGDMKITVNRYLMKHIFLHLKSCVRKKI